MRSRWMFLAGCSLLLAACTTTPTQTLQIPDGSGAALSSSPQIEARMERASYAQILAHAEKGEPEFQFELGAMYHDGDGVEKDLTKAFQWYTKSANAGNRQAQFNLGMMEKNGDGIPVDLGKARSWFVRASDKGDVRAANQLGVMAYTGAGMTKDFAKALQYFTKAAMGGLAEAQLNVGVIHIRAEGVPQDLVEGCAWLTVSKDGGWERSVTLLSDLRAKMTTEQTQQCDERTTQLKKDMKEKGTR